MSLSELCTQYVNTSALRDEIEKNVIEFCEAPWGLSLGADQESPPLAPAQKFILKAYYNIPLDNKEKNIIINDKFNEQQLYVFTEMEYLNYLWNEGRINVKEITGNPKEARPNLVLVIGRRGFKTTTIGILSAFETYKLLKKYSPQQYYRMMLEDEIRISCIATTQEQASELFRRIAGHLEKSDYFKKYRNKPTLTYMQISTQRDLEMFGMHQRPSLRLVAAPCSGKSLRGPNNMVAILDELAHFFELENSQDRSDKTIYDSVTPSTAGFMSPEGEPHGRIIAISSPAMKSGKFWELYQWSMDPQCKDMLMIQAPTWEINYRLSPKVLRSKYAEDPIVYMSEYGAQFSDRICAWIPNEQVLKMNVISGLKEREISLERTPHFIGIDVGLKNDGTAIAITHPVKQIINGVAKDFIELDCAEVRYAHDEDKDYFHPEEIAEWIASFTKKFFIVKGMMDQYYGLSILPYLEKHECKQFEIRQVTREITSQMYQNLMSKMLDAALRIPEGTERLIGGRKVQDIDLVLELLRLQATHHSKYIISVHAPEVKDAHDDLSDAFVRSVFLTTEYLVGGGSGLGGNTISAATDPTYKKYYLRHKKASLYTNRPSSGLQSELSRNTHFGSRGMQGQGSRLSLTGRY